jgi:hypothetical protein
MPTTVHDIRRTRGIAGQYSLIARVESDQDDAPRVVEFVGSVYGGPVVMRLGELETFVSDPGRFGEFGEDWVRRFFQED